MRKSSLSARHLAIILAIITLTCMGTTAIYFYFQASPKITNTSQAIISTSIKPTQTPDTNEALTVLYSLKSSNNRVSIAKDKLASLWFEKSFSEGENKYHAVFIKNQLVDAETNDVYGSHADAPIISAVVYKWALGKWVLLSKQMDIGVFGSWGDTPKIKQVQQLVFAKGHVVFLLDIGYSGQGYTNSGKTLFSYHNNRWSQLGYLQTDGDNSGVCDDEAEDDEFLSACWSFNGKITLAENNQTPDYPNLYVSRSGTMGDEEGKIIPVKNSLYSFNGEEYTEMFDELN